MILMYRAHKKHSDISAWENSKKAATEAELRKIEVRTYFISANCNSFSEDCLICVIILGTGINFFFNTSIERGEES